MLHIKYNRLPFLSTSVICYFFCGGRGRINKGSMVAADMAIHAEESRASTGNVHMGWICAKAWKESKELYGRLDPFLRVGVSELPEGIEKNIVRVIK